MAPTTEQKMLKALLLHMGLYQVVDCWAAGVNEGGRYVSLFNSRANFRICAVYEEQFRKLPPFIVENIDAAIAGGAISNERKRLEEKNLLQSCPAFAISRWQMGGGGDDEREKWRFGDVLWVSEQRQPAAPQQPPMPETPPPTVLVEAGYSPPPPPAPPKPPVDRPPTFHSRADALRWAVEQGAWPDEDEARAAYLELVDKHRPSNASEIFPHWKDRVRKRRGTAVAAGKVGA